LRASINTANIGAAATPDPHPDCRAHLTQIVALYPSKRICRFGIFVRGEETSEKKSGERTANRDLDVASHLRGVVIHAQPLL
jgi:hypothetical protein